MATNLTPELLLQLLAKTGMPMPQARDINGTTYQTVYGGNAQGEAGQGQEGGLEQILSYDRNRTAVGDRYSMYDPTGKYTGQGAFKKVKDGDLLATGLISALGMMYGLPAMPGSEAAAAVAPAGEMGTSLAAIEGAGNLAPTLGAEAAGGIGSFAAPGLDVAAGLAGTAPEFAGMSGFAGSLGGAGGFGGASLLPALAAGSAAAPASTGLMATLAQGAGSAGSALAGNKGLAAGLAALGGALGSKGQEANQSSTTKLDPRMDSILYGADGKSGYLNDLMTTFRNLYQQGGLNSTQREGMAAQRAWLQSPEYAQGFNAMKNLGMGLMNRGVAANPFAS